MSKEIEFKSMTASEVLDFMLSDESSLLAKVKDTYISLYKLHIGDADMIYSSYGYRPDFVEYYDSKYDLFCIAANGTVYVNNQYSIPGFNDLLRSRASKAMTLEKYAEEMNQQAAAIFNKWFDALPVEDEISKMDQTICERNACAKYVKFGTDISKMQDQTFSQSFVTSETAIRFLTGTKDLEEHVLTIAEGDRNDCIHRKTMRKKTLELAVTGSTLSSEAKAIADALRDLDANLVTVYFESNGQEDSAKMSKQALQGTLQSGCILYATAFAVMKEGDRILRAFGGPSRNVPLSCVSRIMFRGKPVYVRKDIN